MSPTKSALVFGASGLAGWGVVDQLLSNYPSEGTFSKVTALVNRPLKADDSYWPSPSLPKLSLISGINLTSEGFMDEFVSKVEDIGSVTHVFYFGISVYYSQCTKGLKDSKTLKHTSQLMIPVPKERRTERCSNEWWML